MIRVLIWVLAGITILWLVRTLGRAAAYWLGVSEPHAAEGRRGSNPVGKTLAMAPRELMKDPQCGTYIAPELSIRASFRGRELHFCSHECEQRFLQTTSEK
jgi:YHS domain-containing protein